MDNLLFELVELKEESTILERNEETQFSQNIQTFSPRSNPAPQESPVESESNEHQDKTNDSSSSEEPTLSTHDNNVQRSENPIKSEKQTASNNDAYITKLLEKLIKERDRLVELGVLMGQGESGSKKQLASPKSIKGNQENMDPSEEVTSQKSSRRKTGAIEYRAPITANKPEEKDIIEDEETKQLKAKQAAQARLRNFSLDELLHISRKEASFGTNLPGQIIEESLEVVNKSNENLVVEIIIDCLNEELQDTDEYVYSIRRSHAYDYNDKHYLIMAPFSSASFRLALKVPSVKVNGDIRGQARITVQSVNGKHVIEMFSGVSIPKVFCPRELYYKPLKTNIIKVAIKQGKKLESKIPLKNMSDVQITLDLEFHKSKAIGNSKFDCFIYPTSVTIPPGGMTIVTLMLKYVGGGIKDNKDLLKRVLIGKARESALTYSFLLWIETY
jgi:hypothetical protein